MGGGKNSKLRSVRAPAGAACVVRKFYVHRCINIMFVTANAGKVRGWGKPPKSLPSTRATECNLFFV